MRVLKSFMATAPRCAYRGFCWIWVFLRRNWTIPRAALVLAPTARWICAWIRGREKARRSGSRAHHNSKCLRLYEDMEKSGLLGRLQRRLQLAGCNRIDMGRSRAHANWLNSWRVQSNPPAGAPSRDPHLSGYTDLPQSRASDVKRSAGRSAGNPGARWTVSRDELPFT